MRERMGLCVCESTWEYKLARVRVCMCVRERVCVCACDSMFKYVHASVCMCVREDTGHSAQDMPKKTGHGEKDTAHRTVYFHTTY